MTRSACWDDRSAAMWAARGQEGGHAGHLREALRVFLTTQNSPKAYPASLHRRVSGKGLGARFQHLPAKPFRPHAATLSPLGYESPAQQVTGRGAVIQGFWGKRRPAARKGITYTRQRCPYRHVRLQGTFQCLSPTAGKRQPSTLTILLVKWE